MNSLNKRFRLAALAFSLISMLLIFGCSKSDDNNSSSIPGAVAPVLPGDWMIHYYFDVTDKTNNYVDYTFTFNSNGTFVAKKGGSTYNGTWKDEVDSGKRKLTLDFDASVTESALLELEEDWIVTSSSSTLINLEDKAVVMQMMKL